MRTTTASSGFVFPCCRHPLTNFDTLQPACLVQLVRYSQDTNARWPKVGGVHVQAEWAGECIMPSAREWTWSQVIALPPFPTSLAAICSERRASSLQPSYAYPAWFISPILRATTRHWLGQYMFLSDLTFAHASDVFSTLTMVAGDFRQVFWNS